MTLLIQGGRVLDPASHTDQIADVLIEDGMVKKIGKKLKDQAELVIDAAGKYVMPGFIDLHVHLRDPGQTDKETVETGAAAAAKGEKADVIIMDPPRSGSAEVFMKAAVKMKPSRIIYVSCGPESLARDLKWLTHHGYIAEKIQPVDMFPMTGCVENVCLLVQRSGLHVKKTST